MRNDESVFTRRTFLKGASACAAHMALMASPFPTAARKLWSARQLGDVVAREPFGRLEQVGPGLFAFISTPLAGDYTTVCNGGIVVGSAGVLVVEAFQTPEGARWIAERARELAGRWPTHVLVTHYHGDHTSGILGFSEAAELRTTETTRTRRVETLPADAPRELRNRWADVVLTGEEEPSELDLGDRVVQVLPFQGHTGSDVAVDLPEEELCFCGDLVWNGMFPNYMDAKPSQLDRSVRILQRRNRGIYVPGHGPLADSSDYARYVTVLEGIEAAARRAVREGWTAEEAGQRHQIPSNLGEWTLFNPTYFQRAIEAWMMEWGQ